MKKYLLNYATREFIYSQKLLTKSALENGIDDCFIYGKDDLIKTDFYRNNLEILESKRGAGYWLWKPFYIYESLNKIDDGDILFYSDSGIKIIKDLNVLTKRLFYCLLMAVFIGIENTQNVIVLYLWAVIIKNIGILIN